MDGRLTSCGGSRKVSLAALGFSLASPDCTDGDGDDEGGEGVGGVWTETSGTLRVLVRSDLGP